MVCPISTFSDERFKMQVKKCNDATFPKKKGKILIDPNKLSQDGTVALNTYEPSPHGNFIVYSVTQSGSDWKTWHLMEVASQKNLDDTIQWTKFTNISWSPDESGFYYTGYKAPKQEGKKHQTQIFEHCQLPSEQEPLVMMLC